MMFEVFAKKQTRGIAYMLVLVLMMLYDGQTTNGQVVVPYLCVRLFIKWNVFVIGMEYAVWMDHFWAMCDARRWINDPFVGPLQSQMNP